MKLIPDPEGNSQQRFFADIVSYVVVDAIYSVLDASKYCASLLLSTEQLDKW